MYHKNITYRNKVSIIHKTFSGVNTASATATFDFSELENYRELTIDNFITIPMPGSIGLSRSYYDTSAGVHTRSYLCVDCGVSYDNATGILTMSLKQISADINNPLIVVPDDTVHAYYIPKID